MATNLSGEISKARLLLNEAWDAHQQAQVHPGGSAFEKIHEAQRTLLDMVTVLHSAVRDLQQGQR